MAEASSGRIDGRASRPYVLARGGAQASGALSVCLAVLLAQVNALSGALFGTHPHPLGELRAVFGDPSIAAVGESWTPREAGCGEPTTRQQSQEGWYCRTSRASLALRRDEVPRGHPLGGRQLSEQVVGLGSLQRERA